MDWSGSCDKTSPLPPSKINGCNLKSSTNSSRTLRQWQERLSLWLIVEVITRPDLACMRIVLKIIDPARVTHGHGHTHLERNDRDTFVIMLTTIRFPPYLGACWYVCLSVVIPVQPESVEDLPEPYQYKQDENTRTLWFEWWSHSLRPLWPWDVGLARHIGVYSRLLTQRIPLLID